MELIGYVACIFSGLCLGITGAGGSILTVPVLVYFFGLSPLMAGSYSLFLVGISSMGGALQHALKGTLNTRAVIFCGLPSLVLVYLIRTYILPFLKNGQLEIGMFSIPGQSLLMPAFGLLMLGAGLAMIRRRKECTSPNSRKGSLTLLLLCGAGTGLACGLLGAGGGFLLIPAMVLVLNMEMKEAAGTSLLIIALNSVIGFAIDLRHLQPDLHFLLRLSLLSLAGMYAGKKIGEKMNENRLRRGFGLFIIVTAMLILIKELWN